MKIRLGRRDAVFVAIAAVALLVIWGIFRIRPTTLLTVGYVEAELLQVSCEYPGRLVGLSVRRGQKVDRLDQLFQIDAAEQQAVLLQLQSKASAAAANVSDISSGRRKPEIDAMNAQKSELVAQRKNIQDDVSRKKALFKKGFVSPSAMDALETSLAMVEQRIKTVDAHLLVARMGARDDQIAGANAELRAIGAQIDQVKLQVGKRSVSAPIGAQVFDTYFDVGELVPQGVPVVSLLPETGKKLRFFVAKSQLDRVGIGSTVLVKTGRSGETIPARVDYVSPRADFAPPFIFSKEARERLTFLAEARFQERDAVKVHPGEPVDVLIQ